eukprot:666273_1
MRSPTVAPLPLDKDMSVRFGPVYFLLSSAQNSHGQRVQHHDNANTQNTAASQKFLQAMFHVDSSHLLTESEDRVKKARFENFGMTGNTRTKATRQVSESG